MNGWMDVAMGGYTIGEEKGGVKTAVGEDFADYTR